jgi:hypothetical protein
MSDFALLISRDPLGHTTEDVTTIITHLRTQRHLFNAAKAKPKATAAPKTPGLRLTANEKVVSDLNLDVDLGDL